MIRSFLPAALGASLLPVAALHSFRQQSPEPSNKRAAYASSVTLEARRARADFAPDADLAKEPWKRAEWTEFNRSMSGKEAYPAATTRVASLWTDRYIYFAFSC